MLCLAYIANESCDSCRAGATTSPLIIILCSQHTAFLLFCVGTHCQRVMRLMPCGGYDKSSYYYFVFSTHRFLLLFCVGTHCQQVMRLMPCGGYDKSSYYYFVFSTHCFLLFVLARFANESCDSCRAGATTSPLIIILCLQHTAFLLFPPFLLARNMTVRGSRYSCCLGHRLLFPYMILFKLYICWKRII